MKHVDPEKLKSEVPLSLRSKSHWLVWKSVRFTKGNGEPTLLKVPYYVDGRKRRGVLGGEPDRNSLATFEHAVGALSSGKYDGVGFAPMPEDELTILDLDKCIDSHGKYSEFATAVLNSGTYVETSPSGRGLRAVYRGGAVVEGKRNGLIENGERVEIYCGNAFVTITGNRVSEERKARKLPPELKRRLSPVIAGHGMGSSSTAPTKNEAGETLISPDAAPLPDFSIDHARVVLSKLPEVWGQPGRGTWYRVAAALHAQFDGSEEAYDLLDEWSQTLDGYDPEANRSRWSKGFSHTRGRGGLTTMKNLVFESMHNGGLKARRATLARWGIARQRTSPEFDIDLPDTDEDEAGNEDALPEFADLRQLADVSHMYREDPPKVDWLVENFIARRNVAVLGGGSGTSKSFFAMQLTMSAAAGIESFGGMKISEGGFRTLYLAYEDTSETMHGRVYKLRQYIGERVDIVGDETYIDDLCRNFSMLTSEVLDSGAWVFLKQTARYTPSHVTELAAYLRDYIKEQDIDLIVVDTGSESHTADENTASDMVILMRLIRQLAHSSNCGVLVIQHVQKGVWNLSLDEINQSSIRGSSVLVDKARNVVMLARMPRKDAPRYGLPDNHETHDTYVALKHVKANLGGYVPLTVFERGTTGMLIHRPDIREQAQDFVEVAEEDAQENRRAIRIRHMRQRIFDYVVEQNREGTNPSTTMIRAWAMENGMPDTIVGRILTAMRVENQLIELPDEDHPRSKCWAANI